MKETDSIQLLRNRKLKVTPTRQAVLGLLADRGKAVSYNDIQNKLGEVDRVTLYRTLNTLMKKGLVHKALEDAQETYYALCPSQCSDHQHDHMHIHFKCTSCDTVSCIETEESLGITLPNMVIEDVEVRAKGKCANCA